MHLQGLLVPPITFIIVLSTIVLCSYLFSRCAFKPAKHTQGEGKPYACGEDMPEQMIQPDYSQFFPFAFYFTILHVVALMIATVPAETPGTLAIAVIYILGAVVGLFILLRK